MRKFLLAALAVGVVMFGAACSDEDNPLSSSQQGSITVNLHDQASPAIVEAMMTVDSVTLTAADGTEYALESAQLDTPFDLAQLTGGNQVNLGVEPVPAGDYVQMTIVVSELNVTVDTDPDNPVSVISPASPLTVQMPLSVTVAAGEDVVIGVDFPLTAIGFDGTNWTVDGSQVVLD